MRNTELREVYHIIQRSWLRCGLICAADTKCENDQPKDLFELVDEAKENAGADHQDVTADPGFCSYEVLEKTKKE